MSKEMIFPVSRIVYRIKEIIEDTVRLDSLWIQGEISNLKKYRSGTYYFSIKDDKAAMSCVMFSSYVKHLKFDLEEGMKVLISASASVYPERGSLQLYVKQVRPDGIGALYLELEQRKQRLLKEGYFDPAHKLHKPSYIGNVGVITAKEGAALQDVLSTIRMRWPMMQITLYPALVQGNQAAQSIIAQLAKADCAGHDALLIVRGGGSFEDLFCFNDEALIHAVYACKTYTICGVGHKTDTTLIDFVADMSCPTPTAAAQFASLDQREVLQKLAQSQQYMSQRMEQILALKQQQLSMLLSNPYMKDPKSWVFQKRLLLDSYLQSMDQTKDALLSKSADLEYKKSLILQSVQHLCDKKGGELTSIKRQLIPLMQRIDGQNQQTYIQVNQNFMQAMQQYRELNRQACAKYISLLDAYSPLKTMQRGYSITTCQNTLVRSIDGVSKDMILYTQVGDGTIESKVIDKRRMKDAK